MNLGLTRRAFIASALASVSHPAFAAPPLRQIYSLNPSSQEPQWKSWNLLQKVPGEPSSDLLPLVRRIENGLPYLETAGPYVQDSNHIAPGAGYVNLMAIASNGMQSGASTPPVIGDGPIDLRGGEFRAVVRARKLRLPRKARIGLWFQAEDPLAIQGEGRNVNYFQIQDLICEALGAPRPYNRSGPITIDTDWTAVRIRLSENDRVWVCLGSRKARSDLYGCSDHVSSALARWSLNLGIIALLGNDVSVPITGSLDIARIEILVRPH